MSTWTNVSGPREYSERDAGSDISVGWGWTIGRDTERRDIGVELVDSVQSKTALPDACRDAIRSNGWSAIAEHLHEDTPPRRIQITTHGLHPIYE